jgi:predicted amidohydrolase YtcJ
MTRHQRSRRPSWAIVAAIAVLATGWHGAAAQPVDLLLTNGKVYVGGDGAPAYEDVVGVKDGAIVFVGAADAAKNLQPAETIDLEGRLVLPGFVDAHVHAADAGIAAGQCSLAEAADLAGADRIIRDCLAADAPKPDEWFEVILASFVGQHIPISHWDELRADGPMIIRGLDYHTLYANSAALEAAGITAETTAPEGGSIDLSQGFFADAAMELVTQAMPEPTAEETQASYLAGAAYGMRYLNGVGVTSIREAIATEPQLSAYAQLAREGRVTVRSEQSIVVEPKGDPKEEIAKAVALRERFAGTSYMSVNSIKLFADGVIEFPAQTAALLQPYLDPATGKPGRRPASCCSIRRPSMRSSPRPIGRDSIFTSTPSATAQCTRRSTRSRRCASTPRPTSAVCRSRIWSWSTPRISAASPRSPSVRTSSCCGPSPTPGL